MSEMEDKLGAILGNPQMMQQIMSMVQAMSQAQPPQEEKSAPPQSEPSRPQMPDIDLGMLQKLSGLAQQSGADQNQQALLCALSPYLSRERVSKLERAMRAAKMARLASTFLNAGGLSILTGR